MLLRVLVHALDRTGPPMLARSLIAEVKRTRRDIDLDVVAFRGGDLEDDFRSLAPTRVLLEAHEPWDHAAPRPTRVEEIRNAARSLPRADMLLLVSVAGGQCLALLPPGDTPVVTWVVEQGADLHWLDPPVDVRSLTNRWLAGSRSSAAELSARLGDIDVHVAPEFIEAPDPRPGDVDRVRRELRNDSAAPIVMGAGIGTWRKAPDLFVEVALAYSRLEGPPARFVWVGGEHDPLIPLLRDEVARLGLDETVQFHGNVADIDVWLAAADVLCHPARLDAFPLICLHAAAVGTPVVAFSGVGGVPEMFGDSFVGPPYPDVHGLARTLTTGNSEGWAAIAQRQREAIRPFMSQVAGPRVIDLAVSADVAGHESRAVNLP